MVDTLHNHQQPRIAVLGLGYVGLPLAAAFGERFDSLGFDIDAERVRQLREGYDHTRELDPDELARAERLRFSDDVGDLTDRDVYIVTVPTPIDDTKRPCLDPLESASRQIGAVLAAGDTVIYESTVYPGAVEEVCVPILEATSALTCNQDFFVGYSPERMNPGDRQHRLSDITKVTAGSTPATADFIDALYATIIAAGTHKTSSIRVAEAAKVIENTQRDVNIALVNELAMLFNKLGLDTEEILTAARTKWNFLPFRPGLVGGHCIGVDPYYLTYKAEAVDHHPEMILAGRRINDHMGAYVAGVVVKLLAQRGQPIAGGRVLVLGMTFKENTPDIRNTQAIDILHALAEYNIAVDVHDPWADPAEARDEFGLELTDAPEPSAYNAAIVAVAHRDFAAAGAAGLRQFLTSGGVLYDTKCVLEPTLVDARL